MNRPPPNSPLSPTPSSSNLNRRRCRIVGDQADSVKGESRRRVVVVVLLAIVGESKVQKVLAELPRNIVRSVHKRDRKSTRLNSSHGYISYAAFCLKKKNTDRECRGRSTRSRRATAPRRSPLLRSDP